MMDPETKQLYHEAAAVGRSMRVYGSSFEQALVGLMEVADARNMARIRATWPELWARHLEMSALMEAKA